MGRRTILCSNCNKPLQINDEEDANQATCPVCNKKTSIPLLSETVEELDFYPINKPYTYISILKEKDSLKKRYVVLEPILSDDDRDVLDFLTETIVKTLTVRLDELGDKAESYLVEAVDDILEKYEIIVDGISWDKIVYYLKKHFLGYDDIDPLMNDPYIEDISCDGAKVPLFVYQRRYGSLETNVLFSDDDALAKFVIKLAQKCGKHISMSDPMLDATMPDGSRIQMTLRGEVTTRGSTFTIRKFRADPITPVDLIDYDTFSVKMIAYLWMAVENGFNALISGGTASGKTSALNALALFIPRESKIVSIEETREINLPHPNWIPGVTRSGFGEVVNDRMVGEIDLFDLMKAALRQRPEYILVGEIRGREAYVLFQAMATGHTTYSTVHADSTQALIHRLEGKPINIPRTMLQSLDIVLLMRNQKTQDKQQRRCIKVVELLTVDNETSEVLTNSVFEWDPPENVFTYSGKSYILEQIRSQRGMNAEEMMQEVNQRADILAWMNKYHIREFTDVSNILAKYAETPEKVLDIITKEPEKIDEEIKESLFSHESDFDSLLDNPVVVKRNKLAKQREQEKKDKGILFGSLFSKKSKSSNYNLFESNKEKKKDTQIKTEQKKSAGTKKESENQKKTDEKEKRNILHRKKNPSSYYSQKKPATPPIQKYKEVNTFQEEKEKNIEFFHDTPSNEKTSKQRIEKEFDMVKNEIDQTLNNPKDLKKKESNLTDERRNQSLQSSTFEKKKTRLKKNKKTRKSKHKTRMNKGRRKQSSFLQKNKERIEKLSKTRVRFNKDKIKSKLKINKE